jgi:hypothetical protein
MTWKNLNYPIIINKISLKKMVKKLLKREAVKKGKAKN